MSKSKEHWMTAMIFLLTAGLPPTPGWLAWIFVIVGMLELLASVWTAEWMWKKKST